MILEKLTVKNFRVFEGKHTFDLTPRVIHNKKCPIILFGGLNGAGKTTILNGIRLALYGKQSLGIAVNKKDYADYLEKSIHRSKDKFLQVNSSSIELVFSYSNLGIKKQYSVKRKWTVNSKNSVFENLIMSEDGSLLSELNDEQCQGFLNELIPIGVSDLFFFDGEKIAELAEDTKGVALGDSIKKLLGLDILETLNADLSILLRLETKRSKQKQVQDQIEELEKTLLSHEHEANKALEEYHQTLITRRSLDADIQKLENLLSARGGAWAVSREDEIAKQAKLSEEKRNIEDQIREIFSANYPFAIAADFALQTLAQLQNESKCKRQAHTDEIVKKHLNSLRNSLANLLDTDSFNKVKDTIDTELVSIGKHKYALDIIHDISDSLLSAIEFSISDALTQQKNKINQLSNKLNHINKELDKARNNIARAPEESQIQPILNQLTEYHKKIACCIARQKEYTSLYKSHIREGISVARQLDKLVENFATEEEQSRTFKYANGAKSLLNDFAIEMANRKVKDLENEFVKSFSRLARKEDVSLVASINPETFTVTLKDAAGREINKDELSAGEKQIYAIAILEALARTSGRRLPIIIDTPLGRLDSIHRTKLINNYFPYASHQVIILSTDTEVDESFYSDMLPSISHAYKLNYDSEKGCTVAVEGYFWRNQNAGALTQYASK